LLKAEQSALQIEQPIPEQVGGPSDARVDGIAGPWRATCSERRKHSLPGEHAGRRAVA